MRKQTKLVAVLSAAALLAMGASMTSFAAGWEKDDAGVWHYYDKDDEMVTGEWRKDGAKWFYLDEDGDMLLDSWVDDEYYVGADGAMLVNQWAKTTSEDSIDDPDDEGDHWFYFGNKGKKISDDHKKINGKTYYFNEDGEMRDGWYSPDNGTAVYYLGGEDEGGRAENQWLWLECPTDDDSEDGEWVDPEGDACKKCDDEGWYWFGSDGKMYKESKKKTINGKYYFFNEHGQMLYEWINTKSTDADSTTSVNANDGVYAENERAGAREEAASKAEAASGAQADAKEVAEAEFDSKIVGNMVYANQVEDGSRINGWREIEGSEDAGTDDSTDWYFFDDGEAKKAITKNGKDRIQGATDDENPVYRARIKVDSPKGGKAYFCFNELGQMQTGLQYIPDSKAFYYFDGDGYPKTGKVADVEEEDNDVYDYYFSTKNGGNGKGFTGEKDGYLYWNGKRLEADDDYKFYMINGDLYLVNGKGKLQKSNGKKYALDDFDGNEVYIKIDNSYKVRFAAIAWDDDYWYTSSKEYKEDKVVNGEMQVKLRPVEDVMKLLLIADKRASVPSISVYDNVFAPENPFVASNGRFYDSEETLDERIQEYIKGILDTDSEEE